MASSWIGFSPTSGCTPASVPESVDLGVLPVYLSDTIRRRSQPVSLGAADPGQNGNPHSKCPSGNPGFLFRPYLIHRSQEVVFLFGGRVTMVAGTGGVTCPRQSEGWHMTSMTGCNVSQ